jgi:hypothetical protein
MGAEILIFIIRFVTSVLAHVQVKGITVNLICSVRKQRHCELLSQNMQRINSSIQDKINNFHNIKTMST